MTEQTVADAVPAMPETMITWSGTRHRTERMEPATENWLRGHYRLFPACHTSAALLAWQPGQRAGPYPNGRDCKRCFPASTAVGRSL